MTPINQRAYELAKSGSCADLEAVEAALEKEGYNNVRDALLGPIMREELTLCCEDAQKQAAPALGRASTLEDN